MEGDMNQQQTSTLCRGGCGFFGSPATEGLCSKCFKDTVKRKQDTTARLSPTALTPTTVTAEAASTSTSTVVQAAAVVADKLREVVSCAQAAKSTEEVTAVMESAEAVAAAAVDNLACSSGTSSAAISASSSAVSLDTMEGAVGDAQPPAAVKKPNRCQMCKKRVGLTGFVCRCGGLFCGEHRYDAAHACTFDYKTMEREELRKNNPVIVSEKIQRI